MLKKILFIVALCMLSRAYAQKVNSLEPALSKKIRSLIREAVDTGKIKDSTAVYIFTIKISH